MPYRRGNYDFVIDSSFRPFSFQEMLAPYAIYKDAFEKSEEAYNELRTKADDFKYLSETLPEGSRAREIYEQYANDLNTQALDFAQNGLTMGNRSALTGLRQRYQGEIGRLAKAQTRLDEEMKLRRQMNAKDSSLLYGTQNLSIDDFLDNGTPNLYSISGNELYTKGAAAGQAASKRVYGTEDAGSTLGGYYRDYVQRMGYNAETINRFRQDMSAIPELQAQADAILQANGVYDNLDERGVAQARQQVINGMIDGAVYTESHNPQRDLGKMTAVEEDNARRANRQLTLQEQGIYRQSAAQGLFWDNNTKSFKYDITRDPKYANELWKYIIEDDGNGNKVAKGYSPAYEDAVKKGLIKGYDNDDNSGKGGNNKKSGIDASKLREDYKFEKSGTVSSGSEVKTIPTGSKRITFDEINDIDSNQANQIQSTLGISREDINKYYDFWQDPNGNIYPRVSNIARAGINTQESDSTIVTPQVPGANWENAH